MVIIDTLIHTLLGGLTLHHAGMHCPSWDDAFVSSYCSFLLLLMQNTFLCSIPLCLFNAVIMFKRLHKSSNFVQLLVVPSFSVFMSPTGLEIP